MELLETAKVDAFCKDDIVVPASRRNAMLCVVWEGTCVELKQGSSAPKRLHAPSMRVIQEKNTEMNVGAVWYAGDWTGPIALQPEKALSGESELSATHDVVAMSSQGVKVSKQCVLVLKCELAVAYLICQLSGDYGRLC